MTEIYRRQLEFNALEDIVAERRSQDATWGEQNHHPIVWMTLLTEEVGEAAQEANQLFFYDPSRHAHYRARYREEMVQVAALALAAVVSLDRNSEHQREGRPRQDDWPPSSAGERERAHEAG